MRRKINDDFHLNDLFEIKLIFFYPSRILRLSEFEWTLRSSVGVVYNNFLSIDATDRSKIRRDQTRLFFRRKPIPLSFFTYTPFKNGFKQNFQRVRDG